MKMVEFNVVLFILSFALVWKIVYMSLILDGGVNLNILGDICTLCAAMMFLLVSYHKSIRFPE